LKERLKSEMGVQNMGRRLANLKRAGFSCTGAVDVGAFCGDWARLAHSEFDCPVLLFEPQPAQQAALKTASAGKPFIVEPVALGRQAGRTRFVLEETGSRMVEPDQEQRSPVIEVPVDTLDAALARHAFHANLLKIDVQGFELEVLAGATKSLQDFDVVILEVSVIRIGPVPTFHEVLDFMAQRGFRLYDFLPMYYRPRDGALWQGDAFFARNDSALVASESWS
jgi:FkbM family methyltransferase